MEVNKLDIIIEKLQNIETHIQNTNQRIANIESTLNIINKSSQNMDDHIEFVENIYDVVKNPFSSFLEYYYGKNKHIEDVIHTKRLK
jgi:uncharacterized protein with von Willebrand factor type A (vWA) domain